MPGFFPGRPGGEHDEPLLDMILERRPIPPGAPSEFHGLARMLAAVAGPAEPGDLAGQDAAHAAFAGVLPSPIEHFAYETIGAPSPPSHGISPRPPAGSPDPVSDKTHHTSVSAHERRGHGAVPGDASCLPAHGQGHGPAVGDLPKLALPSPAPNQLKPGSAQSPAQSGPGQNRASPGSSPFPWPLPLASATKVCPAGTTPDQKTHAPGR